MKETLFRRAGSLLVGLCLLVAAAPVMVVKTSLLIWISPRSL